MTPFIAFCYAKRAEVRDANPMARFGDMSRLLSARWKELSESEKSAYADPRYGHKNDGYVLPHEESGLRRSSRLRNKRLGLNFWGVKLNHKSSVEVYLVSFDTFMKNWAVSHFSRNSADISLVISSLI